MTFELPKKIISELCGGGGGSDWLWECACNLRFMIGHTGGNCQNTMF